MLPGLMVKLNRLFLNVLRHLVFADMQDWDQHPKIAQLAVNNLWQESVQETTNRGRHPRSPLTVKLPTLPLSILHLLPTCAL